MKQNQKKPPKLWITCLFLCMVICFDVILLDTPPLGVLKPKVQTRAGKILAAGLFKQLTGLGWILRNAVPRKVGDPKAIAGLGITG